MTDSFKASLVHLREVYKGALLDINLLDHIIIGNNQHFSFFSHGLIPK
ncbi:MAG: hypothetical protein JZU70_05735 [Chlorobium sp.]|nr:hypothetical protein [Chlorobium sp.]